jgi:hypothetical protein
VGVEGAESAFGAAVDQNAWERCQPRRVPSQEPQCACLGRSEH